MSWLSEVFGGSSNTQIVPPTAEQAANYYKQVKANNPAYYETIKQSDPDYIASQQAAQQSGALAPSVAAAATPAPPAYSGPTAEAKLQALLPQGFENTLIPSTAGDPSVESYLGKGKSAAQSFIENMFKRGTTTGAGRTAGISALSSQDPNVRSKLAGISKTLLEGERGKLRGIAGEGYGAASGQSGETFDPNPYYSRANTEAAQFLGGFPQSFAGAVGDVGGLYDTSGLGGASGAATSTRNVSYDPYAVEGGKLSTGLDEGGKPPPTKKRSTAVF